MNGFVPSRVPLMSNIMKPVFSLVAAVMVAFLATARTNAEDEISYQDFYDALTPYGDWVFVEDYDYCWQPRVDPDWRPYTNGSWVYTDAGWTWSSDEEWGWATDHYGRWMLAKDYGWLWVPGFEWAPAWVSWRKGNDYVGWAPLPPEATWQPASGFGPSVDVHFSIGPQYYNFCPVRYLGAPHLRPYIVPRRENVTIVNNTVNVTRITNINNVTIFNEGPDFAEIARRTEQPIRRARLERRQDVNPEVVRAGQVRNTMEGDVLRVVAPRVERSDRQEKPSRLAGSIRRDQIVERNRREEGSGQPPGTSQADEPSGAPRIQRTDQQSRRDRDESSELGNSDRGAQSQSDRQRFSQEVENGQMRGEEAERNQKARRPQTREERRAGQPEKPTQLPPPSNSPALDSDQQPPTAREGRRRGDNETQSRREMQDDPAEPDTQRKQGRRAVQSEQSLEGPPSTPNAQSPDGQRRPSAREESQRDNSERQVPAKNRLEAQENRQDTNRQRKQAEASEIPPQEKARQRRQVSNNERPEQQSAPPAEPKKSEGGQQPRRIEQKAEGEMSGRPRVEQKQQPRVEGQEGEKKGGTKGKGKKEKDEDE